MLEQMYETRCDSSILDGAEIWGIEEGWKIVDGIQGKFCKKVLRIPRNAAKWAAETEIGRDSMTGKILIAGRVKQ
jgi:hypothetical protein